ncbi:uncharacterized protein LOC116417942 [Nasonia vitripennis]|uniref:Uncharacterized protein n=1 Tax=Nasonia vitripennis TaxID=7425 RepID=A0A7M7QKV4_NASVI|nr:uncharacterized protein LOC116417942 [Nasonia vitripennis]
MSGSDRSCTSKTDSSSSSSSSSSDDDPAPLDRKTIKRKNRFLDPDFKIHEVSSQTLKKYKQDSLPRQRIPHDETLQANIIEPESDGVTSATDDLDAAPTLLETSSFNEYLHDETLQSDDDRDVSATAYESICNSDNQNKIDEIDLSNNSDNDSSTDVDYDESNSSDDSEIESDFDSPDDRNVKNDYIFSKLMFEASKLTVRDVIVLNSAFALRYHLPDEARLMLMKMFQLCAGPTFDSLNLSIYLMSECLSSQNDKITKHYYCSKCSEVIMYYVNAAERQSNKKLICQKCKANNIVTQSSPNYFMSIDLYSQFSQFFSNKENVDNLLKNINARNTSFNTPCDSITDVHDGSIYRSMKCSTVNHGNELEYMLTLNISTDGAPLTKSGKRAFWPLQVIINDLSPKLRFRYVFLAGLLIVKQEPKSNLMNLYIQTFIDKQLNNLNTRKLTIVNKNNTRIVLKFNILSCVVDSVCLPIIQNRLQFNGYCGCSWCYQSAEFIKEVCGIRYTFHQESTHRTHESHEKDVKLALETKTIQNGVKGISALQKLQHFDLVWSFPYEYMHGMLLGVTFQIWKEWKSQECLFKLQIKRLK